MSQTREASPLLSIEQVDTLKTLESLEEGWDGLIKDGNITSFFSSFDFIYAWWKHRSYGNSLFTLVVKEDTRIIGIAPLMISDITRFGFHFRKVSFLVGRYIVSDFVIGQWRKEECIRLIMKYVFERSRCHYVELSCIPVESSTVKIMKNIAKEMGVAFRADVCSKGCFLPIQGAWDTFIRSRSEKFRKRCRENINRLNRLGQVKVVRVRNSMDTVNLIDRVLGIERKSWKTQWISDKANIGFLVEIIERCNSNGWLDLSFLELNNTPIAYWFNIRYGDKAYAMFTTYDEDYAVQSPGFVLLYYVVDQLFSERDNVRELDFLTSMPYILRWTKLERERMQVTMYSKGFLSQLVRFARSIIHFAHRQPDAVRRGMLIRFRLTGQ